MRHRLFLTLISAVLIISLNACSFLDNKDVKKQEDSSSGLTVLSWQRSKIDGVINQFNTLYPETKIKDKRYFDEDEGGVKVKALTELMAGEGPDILIIKAQDFPNVHKMLENKTFYNLDKLIKNDKSFKIEDYNQVVMNSGIYEGKRYLVPLYSNLPVMITTKSFLSKQGFSIPDGGISWTELSQMTKKFVSNGKNKAKYMFSSDYSFENLLQCSYMKYIDYSKRKSSFDSTEFITLLNMCKELQPAVCPAEIAKKDYEVNMFIKGTTGFLRDDNTMEVSNLSSYNSICKQYMGEEMYLVPFPADQQKADINANVRVVAAINANCKRPQEAFEFLELLLQKNNQTPHLKLSDRNYIKGSPVNIEAWKEELEYNMTDIGSENSSFGDGNGNAIDFFTSPLSSNMGAKIDGLYNGITKAEFNDYRVFTILSEETKDFLEGRTSADETAKAINQKVMLYLNE